MAVRNVHVVSVVLGVLAVSGLIAWVGLNLVHSASGERTTAPVLAGQPTSSPCTPVDVSPSRRHSTATPAPIRFIDVTDQLGIQFTHVSGITTEKHFPAANGSGLAVLDADGDGWLDLYFLTACRLPVTASADSPRNRLYRAVPGASDSPPNAGSAELHYRLVDVAVPSGLAYAGFSQGVTVGDLDNDGFDDVYMTALGGNHQFQNMGDGTFQDVTVAARSGVGRWGASVASLDYDHDGCLDLYVANYGRWAIESNDYCGDRDRGIRLFCRPTYIPPEVHALLRNQGDGTFEETTGRAGIARKDGRGQGVVAADLNGDGRIDIYVANDMCPNFLFLNRGDGTFDDATDLSGAAYDGDGSQLAGMGVDATDVDGDGLPELFVTNFLNEYNNLYKNCGQGFFEDISTPSSLGPSSLHEVGWGTRMEDLDNDGWADVIVVNGHVDDNMHLMGRREPYRQRPRVWRNRGQFRFEEVSAGAGEYFQRPFVSRGLALGDLDQDGRLDFAALHVDERPAVLLNRSEPSNRSIRLELIGRSSNRNCIGTRVELTLGDRLVARQVKGGGSYLSAHDYGLTIGVGTVSEITKLVVRWPSGAVTTREAIAAGRSLRLSEPPVSAQNTRSGGGQALQTSIFAGTGS